VGALAYAHLNGDITAAPLFSGTTGDAGAEKPDAFGKAPINILVIGSDGRSTPADCHLGGDCGPGANADVEMLVHVSADRSNATVMSIPRDTVTDLPACRDTATGASMARHVGQINSTLTYGPGCTVAAVHQLTGIPIDHFAMVDFTGVVTMSDAVGGVQVCVSSNVYDPYSHLKLTKGTHTLKDLGALEFLRSRHAFGDGSDLGRTYAQHLFLSALIRNLESAGTLANPAAVYSLADAATKALTVDTGLGSIPSLVGLAADLDKVPAQRVTFTTMPNSPDPTNAARVVMASAAKGLLADIVADRSLSADQARAGDAGVTARAGTSYPGGVIGGSSTASQTLVPSLADAHAQTASQTGTCARVSRDKTVVVAGRAMTPLQAFADSRAVPMSTS
jgi:LCP family protein required for cell wall assembly